MSAKTLIRAVGYARRSTDMQERSIPDQKASVERWAAEHGYRILRWYVDDAISGTSAKGRAAFERLLHEAENGRDFDAVLCYDIPRFSRGGTYETGYYLYRLKLAGVEVLFTAEGIPEGDEGELVAGVKSWQAKQYSVRLSRDCIRGTISHIMQKRCAPGGKPPYGYDKQHCTAAGQVLRTFRWLPDGRKQEYGPDGKLIRVLAADETVKKAKSDVVRYIPSAPDRVAVVKRIFEQCAAGYGYHYIAARLNEDGVASSTGVPWNANEIRRMLENPAYRGAVAWNRRTLGKLYGVAGDGTLRTKRGRGDRRNAEEDWFVVEDAHEALVTPALFRRARAAVAGRRDQGGLARPTNRSLLSGLIVCGHCRQNFLQKHVNSISGGKPLRYRYYTDGGYNRGGRTVCTLTNIPADALDHWVVQKVRHVLLGDHAGVDAAVDTFVRAARSRTGHDDGGDALAGVERELDAVNRRIKATVAMIADPTFDGLDELRQTLTDLKTRRDALQARLADARGASATPLAERELRAWATDRFRRFDQLCDFRRATPEARALVHAYVDRIEIDPHARRGVLFLPADAFVCLQRDFSTRLTLEEPRGGVKSKGEV
jgi:DNA invertase Pin-like site-specific DNA recombinase